MNYECTHNGLRFEAEEADEVCCPCHGWIARRVPPVKPAPPEEPTPEEPTPERHHHGKRRER